MRYSFKLRLTLVSFFSLIFLASGVAYFLERAFDNSLTTQLNERMKTQLLMLLTAAEEEEPGKLYLPEVVREDTFNQIDSGNYAFVYTGVGRELWRSFSAVDLDLQLAEVIPTGDYLFDRAIVNNVKFYRLRYAVIWESFDGSEHYYQFTLLQESHLLQAIIDDFRVTLWSGLFLVLILMVLIQLLALHWGLRPLDLIAFDLKKIESGQQHSLQGDYPRELYPLTQNLNFLIEAERQQREKYRNTLSNLAHSLKTPLAVIKGEVHGGTTDQALVNSQINRMDEIIQYQLTRAVSGSSGSMLSSVNVDICIEKILSALEKVYQSKGVKFTYKGDASARFFGDEGDLMEMLGNLLDNAGKWTSENVWVDVNASSIDVGHQLEIFIKDDGPGIPKEKHELVLQRGHRLDEQTEGQGIGLSVVAELVHHYGGTIEIDPLYTDGACFKICFVFKRVN